MAEEIIIGNAVRKRKITKVILVVQDVLTGTNPDGSTYKSYNNEDKVSLDLTAFTTATKQELKSKL
jgi:hypothetical protein